MKTITRVNVSIKAFSVTPKNVLILDPRARDVTFIPEPKNVYLYDGAALGGGAGGTYPPAGHVRTGENYGPTGVEFAGTEVLPAVSQVQLGVGYGEDGTEFTGTLAGGGPLKHRVRSVM